MSERHREALAHLLYGLGGGGGFVLLSGEIGAGKTTVCRCFLEQIPPDCNAAYIFNPKLTVEELLQSVCDEFRIVLPDESAVSAGDAGPRPPRSVKAYIDPLNAFLLDSHARGQNNVLIIDEAQQLSAEVLEQLRLLTNLETHERKLLQIILIGQPELRQMLSRPELEQLAQRVIARFHLDALSPVETTQYIQHRLIVAGLAGPLPFDAASLRRIHALARGVPRRINLLCDRALLGAYAHGQQRVGRSIVNRAADEVFGSTGRPGGAGTAFGVATLRPAWSTLAAAAALAAVVAWAVADRRQPSRAAALSSTVSAAPANGSEAGRTGVRAAAAMGGAAAAIASASSTASAAAPVRPEHPITPAELQALLQPGANGLQQAWRALAADWRLDLAPSAADACAAVQRQQVQCFSTLLSLPLIRQLDRPGILTLLNAQRQPTYAVLAGLDGQIAWLRIGDAVRPVPVGELAPLWTGEFSTLWRVPAGAAAAADRTGPVILAQQVAAQLASAASAPSADASAGTASLRRRIVAFQVAQGLQPDGLAGPITLMQLQRANGVEEPHLQTPR
jgi:general secretion pathway protein A